MGVDSNALVSLTTGYEHMLEPLGGAPRLDLQTSLVAFDANVLLGLYRRRLWSAENIIREFSRIRDRLFLPAQAQHEFWLNRDSVLRALRGSGSDSAKALADAKRAVAQAVDAATQLD